MKKTIFSIVILFFFLTIFHLPIFAFPREKILPVGEIEKGMIGIGKTVISGTTVQEFDVEILGVLHDQQQKNELILVKVSGPVIEETGGIAAGMSGSPVYIDGKLIGAIGYGWSLTDHTMGLVTPIEKMLKLYNLKNLNDQQPESINLDYNSFVSSVSIDSKKKKEIVELLDPIKLSDRTITQLYFCDSFQTAQPLHTRTNTLVAFPVKTPILVSGLKGRALTRLMVDLPDFDLVPIMTGTGFTSKTSAEMLGPGSAIAVQLVRGDIEISSIGTLTSIEGNRFLAFGHPFLNLGQVEFFLSGAEILTVVDHQEMPFKLGIPTNLKGSILQDRSAGLMGSTENYPNIIPVNVKVHDHNLVLEEELQFQVVQQEELLVSLITSSVLQSIDSVIDRQGFGTSLLKLEVLGDKIPEKNFIYDNIYYSNTDIAAQSITDLYNILNLFVRNPFEKVNLTCINIQLELTQAHQLAIIEEVELLNETLFPGDTAQIAVTLRPYRKEPFKRVFQVLIPDNIQTGEASLTVSGGVYGTFQDEYNSEAAAGQPNYIQGQHQKSLEELLSDYTNYPRNNDLLIEILPYYLDVPAEESEDNSDEKNESTLTAEGSEQLNPVEKRQDLESDEKSLEKKIQSVLENFKTNYVLEGSLTLEITILDTADTSLDSFIDNPDEKSSKQSDVVKQI